MDIGFCVGEIIVDGRWFEAYCWVEAVAELLAAGPAVGCFLLAGLLVMVALGLLGLLDIALAVDFDKIGPFSPVVAESSPVPLPSSSQRTPDIFLIFAS